MGKNLAELVERVSDYKGITDDSRKVKEGFIFVAIRGATSDGHNFINNAVQNGAKVIVGEKELHVPDADYIRVPDSRDALGDIASAWYGNPSQKLTVIGVTGTKGKTTTVHLIGHILEKLGKKVGLISSITAKIDDHKIDTGFHVTSPDVISLHKLLDEMVKAGSQYAVLEVSSHGIDQKRIAGVNFEVAVLTNIAPEHLDYHKTFEEYKRVKMSFMNSGKTKIFSREKTDINILPGDFNNLDAQAAIDAVVALGFDEIEALKTLSTFKLPEGRLEEVENKRGIKIIIDFAHTPNSLEAVLNYLRKETKGRLIAVFGCAGERDTGKRFEMGKISARMADLSVFTAEDPRSEDVVDIIKEIASGAENEGGAENKTFVNIPERGEAISFALSKAGKGDTVAFLGKGHEKSMAFKGFEHPWNDREVIESMLNPIKDVTAVIMAAGLGTRMNSQIPKVLLEIAGRSMIALTLENLRKVGIKDVVIVVGHKKELVIDKVGGAVIFAEQQNPKGGTADAIGSSLKYIKRESKFVLGLYGDDSAFFKPKTTRRVIEEHIKNGATISFVSAEVTNPYGLGRVIRDGKGSLTAIVEEKVATENEKKIKEINCGHFIFNSDWLSENISKIQPSPSGEYYVNYLIKLAIDQKKIIFVYKLPDSSEWQGINTPEELEKAKEEMEKRLK